MGGGPPSINETTEQMLKALAQYAPDAIAAINRTAPTTAQTQLDTQRQVAPGYAELQNQVYRDYGPEANRIGNEINRANQLAATQTESDVIEGPGRKLVGQADELQRQLDPEFYLSRASIGKGINDFLRDYDPNKLSGSEIENIRRGIASTGGNVSDSALNTLKNAQTFGDRGTERWKNFGDALMKASAVMPSLKSGISGFEVATRRPLQSNSGENRLSVPDANNALSAFNQNFGFANNALNNIGQTTAASIQKRKDIFDMINSATSSFGNLVGSIA